MLSNLCGNFGAMHWVCCLVLGSVVVGLTSGCDSSRRSAERTSTVEQSVLRLSVAGVAAGVAPPPGGRATVTSTGASVSERVALPLAESITAENLEEALNRLQEEIEE